MKKIILVALLSVSFGLGNLYAQLRKVPAEVTNAFKAKYPGAGDVEWKDKINDFQADFTLNGAEITAEFTPGGDGKKQIQK